MTSVSVVPIPFDSNPKFVYGFNYSVQSLVLNVQITLNVVLLDQKNSPLSVSIVTLSGDDYKNWGSDDSYVIEYICNSLGLTLSPVVVEPVHIASVIEPPVVIEEPSVVIEGPSVVIEGPSVVIEEPSVVIEEPSVVIEEPSVVIEEPI